jgi:hypothetical protein
MTYSYNDQIIPHKIKGEYVSTVEKALLESETNKEIANLFKDVCKTGTEFRHAQLAKRIKEFSKLPKVVREQNIELLSTMCSRFHLFLELGKAQELLKSEREFSRLISQLDTKEKVKPKPLVVGKKKCMSCSGAGKIALSASLYSDYHTIECEKCHGTGLV